MINAREALDRIKDREEARGYAVAHEDREAVRLTTIESQKDVGPLTEALEEVLRSVEKIRDAADYWKARDEEEEFGVLASRARANALNICADEILRAIETTLNEEEQG